ncbi:alpha/beta hydrolase [Armatimonas sp.]|uniref:alpha/beta hydrolase n=1 Tax=Armatimonas sp. TaxID=1872638 RepID=UPI003752460A
MNNALIGSLLALGLLGQQAAAPSVIDITKFKPYGYNRGDGNYVIAPMYTNAPELTAQDSVPKGKVYDFVMKSTDSPLFPGIAKNKPGELVPYERRVWVYVPSQYVPGKPAPLLVTHDAMGRGELPNILDNMIAAKRLPPIVAVMISSGGGDAQGSERGLEYDTVSGKYAEYIETAVLPRVSKDYGVIFSKDPDARATMGCSSGAAAAFSMAWFRPDLYHRVISYSGTYVDQQSPKNPESPRGAWEYHASILPQSKRKPLRIWMHVSENDNRAKDPEETLHNWVMANDRMAKILKAKKYPYQFVFSKESGHCDGRVTRQTLAQALEFAWKGYKDRGR